MPQEGEGPWPSLMVWTCSREIWKRWQGLVGAKGRSGLGPSPQARPALSRSSWEASGKKTTPSQPRFLEQYLQGLGEGAQPRFLRPGKWVLRTGDGRGQGAVELARAHMLPHVPRLEAVPCSPLPSRAGLGQVPRRPGTALLVHTLQPACSQTTRRFLPVQECAPDFKEEL